MKVEIITLLVQKGAKIDLSCNDKKSASPLHLAAKAGPNILSALLQSKAKFDINIQNSIGETPLHWAISSSNTPPDQKLKTVRRLIKAGAKIDVLAEEENLIYSPLHLAALQKNLNLFKALLESDVAYDINVEGNDNQTPLHWAIGTFIPKMEKKEIIDLFVKKGAQVDVLGKRKTEFVSPLHMATTQDSYVLETLLQSQEKFNIDVQSNDNETPLFCAMSSDLKENEKIKKINLLIKHGAKIDMLANRDGIFVSPLHLAVNEGLKILKALLKTKVEFNIDVQTNYSETPLFGTMCSNLNEDEKLEMTNLLISHGAKIDIPAGEFGSMRTPLHLASSQSLRILEALLQSKQVYNINTPGGNSDTNSLHWVIYTNLTTKDKKKNFRLLLAKGANLHYRGNENDSIIHGAAKIGEGTMINYVLSNFVDPEQATALVNAQDIRGRTAFHWALRRTFGPKKIHELLTFEQLLNILNALIKFHPDCHKLKDCEGRSVVDWIKCYEQNRNIEKSKTQQLRQIVAACDSNNDYKADVTLEKN